MAATQRLAVRLAALARPGDVILLHGLLGAGKTALARAFIRARARMAGAPDVAAEVPSPTFTLAQLYELDDAPIWHFDLYRLERAEEVWELGLEAALAGGIALIEWPERLGPLLPAERLDVTLEFGPEEDARLVRVVGHGGWAARVAALARP
ncbi:MAG: tRNA (adenosine(37)-N6)-threonylcarbamoyltransferase complex ATPase subunit type 1 TsaE [Alphaproteobacteria bacterium]|nr:tRNA (adenosine(37)-N6)-threonylcarbamoyltransferase complex ATPase subunit type 1 TsaE [Alphaproteobacteria bacterium]